MAQTQNPVSFSFRYSDYIQIYIQIYIPESMAIERRGPREPRPGELQDLPSQNGSAHKLGSVLKHRPQFPKLGAQVRVGAEASALSENYRVWVSACHGPALKNGSNSNKELQQ